MRTTAIGLTPFGSDGVLRGMLISGRWPTGTLEWTQLLVASLRLACRPGLVPATTVFRAVEHKPAGADADTVGLLLAVGLVAVDGQVRPGMFVSPPPALAVIHPPAETVTPVPECETVASGCILLPGVPELGLDHRAGWALADSAGTVVGMRNAVCIDPAADPDTAVLSLLLAA